MIYMYLIKNDFLVYGFDNDGFKFFSTICSFLVVWQSATAYKNMWDARNVFDNILSASLSCCMMAATLTSDDRSSKADQWRYLFQMKMTRLLRSVCDQCEKPDEGFAYTMIVQDNELDMDPNRLALELHELIYDHEYYLGRSLPPPAELRLHQILSGCFNSYGKLSKFLTTPVLPFPIANMCLVIICFFNSSISLFLIQALDDFDFSSKDWIVTALITLLVSYVFSVVNANSSKLCNPFGLGVNDIDFRSLIKCQTTKIMKILSTDSVLLSSANMIECCT